MSEHFARIARHYWDGELYPNTVLPMLAPVFPIIHVAADGLIRLQPDNRMLFATNLHQSCQPAEHYLQHALPPLDAGKAGHRVATKNLRSCGAPPVNPLLTPCCPRPAPELMTHAFQLARQTNRPYHTWQGFQEVITQVNAIMALDK